MFKEVSMCLHSERKRELQKQQKPRMTSARRRSLRLSIEEATNIIQLQKEVTQLFVNISIVM